MELNLSLNTHFHLKIGSSMFSKSFLALGYLQNNERELTDEYRAHC
jgi:urease accessory protein UreH